MKSTIYSVLDRLIQKPVSMEFDEEILKELTHGDQVIYKDSDNKEHVGEFLGYETSAEKSGKFVRILKGKEVEKFERNKQKADKLYKTVFLPIFKKNFPKAVPICARMSIHGNYIYFYFSSNQRLDFANLIGTFREKLSQRFFLYQVNPRDRVRLHPNLDERYDANGLPLSYYTFKHGLDNVPSDAIDLQGLRGRSIEKMRDWSGMLDHSLSYEYDYYKEESKKYPKIRDKITYNNKKYLCIKCNYLTQEIVLRGEDQQKPGEFYGEYLTITLDDRTNKDLKKVKKTQPTSINNPRKKRSETSEGTGKRKGPTSRKPYTKSKGPRKSGTHKKKTASPGAPRNKNNKPGLNKDIGVKKKTQ